VAKTLGKLAERRPGIRVPGAFDGFEVAVRAIFGQQVTVAAARTVAGRFATALGDPVDTPFDGLTTVFPTAARVADTPVSLIARLGMPGVRAHAVVALARSVANGDLMLMPNSNIEATLERLRALPGVGEWTAQYIALRQLREPDGFPAADIGLLRAIAGREMRRPSSSELLDRANAWRPWRAYAAQHLWASA
jgi:AraC family transcriptional regulator of adaptative response / DNA-3-methyladenine glycosylase II